MSKNESGCFSGCSGLFLTVLVVILFFCINVSRDQENQQRSVRSTASASQVSVTAGSTRREKLEYAARAAYGSDIIRLYAENKYPTVDVKISGTVSYIRAKSNHDALRFLREIRKLRDSVGFDFEDIRINVHTDLVDALGNKSVGQVLGFNVKASDIDRIDFENMLESSIPKIAFNWYEHPAMKK